MDSAQLCVVGLLAAATQPCRNRLVRRPAATHRIPYLVATKALAGLATEWSAELRKKKAERKTSATWDENGENRGSFAFATT